VKRREDASAPHGLDASPTLLNLSWLHGPWYIELPLSVLLTPRAFHLPLHGEIPRNMHKSLAHGCLLWGGGIILQRHRTFVIPMANLVGSNRASLSAELGMDLIPLDLNARRE
jgi:hypothetical protein